MRAAAIGFPAVGASWTDDLGSLLLTENPQDPPPAYDSLAREGHRLLDEASCVMLDVIWVFLGQIRGKAEGKTQANDDIFTFISFSLFLSL